MKEVINGKIKTIREGVFTARRAGGFIVAGERKSDFDIETTYDIIGNKTVIKRINSKEEIISETRCEPDSNKLSNEPKYFDKVISTNFITERYDKNGNIVEIRNENNGTLYRNRYDSNNNCVSRNYYILGSLNAFTTYVFDEQNRLLEENFHWGTGKLYWYNHYKYDMRNSIIEKVYYCKNDFFVKGFTNDITQYDFSYDFAGNWISKITNVNECPEEICIRKIDYWE